MSCCREAADRRLEVANAQAMLKQFLDTCRSESFSPKMGVFLFVSARHGAVKPTQADWIVQQVALGSKSDLFQEDQKAAKLQSDKKRQKDSGDLKFALFPGHSGHAPDRIQKPLQDLSVAFGTS